jgi:glycosyl transferase family 1
MRIFVLGAPSSYGGADTELWHTLQLWRRHDVQVTLVPTWRIDPAWRDQCEAIGCHVAHIRGPEQLADLPGLAGSTVVSFCNGNFLEAAARVRELGCPIVWVGCMLWMFDAERRHYERRGAFDRYVFQSHCQQTTLEPELQRYGYSPHQGSVIRGAFLVDDFPYRPRPHEDAEPFVVGRISRADTAKYAADTWAVYRDVDHPIEARVMAWDRRIARKLGRCPDWADCLPANTESSADFLGSLHCMIQRGDCRENWPRSGLEAMALGVPIIAQNHSGWREMIRDGETGFLADGPETAAERATQLARNESLRQQIAQNARHALERELACPHQTWQAWHNLFVNLKDKATV